MLAFCHSDFTRMKKLVVTEPVYYWNKRRSPAFFCPVPSPFKDNGCRNADAGVSFLDVDTQLF
jgi:hypothetical protein